jgi:hypothetical protein
VRPSSPGGRWPLVAGLGYLVFGWMLRQRKSGQLIGSWGTPDQKGLYSFRFTWAVIKRPAAPSNP